MFDLIEQKELSKLTRNFLKAKVKPEQIHQLRSILRFHEWRYAVKNDPIISDTQYDELFNMLQEIETSSPSLITKDSPTQRVTNDITDEFKTVAHIQPMLSLSNAYNLEDLKDFDLSLKRLLKIGEKDQLKYTVEPKFDGGSIAVIYENDRLIRAATRGNGIKGEEMTLNAKAMSSIPLSANFSAYNIYKVELRGESLIRRDKFDSVNKKRSKEGKSLFANPRNAATGGLRTKDPSETRERGIETFIFQMGYAVDKNGNEMLKNFEGHFNIIEFLDKLGFKVPTAEKKLCENIYDAFAFCDEWQNKRDDYDYEIDGMVVKLNDTTLQNRAGNTAHHPRWATAFKFKAKQATTCLESVMYQVGKIGSITPVAKVTPVKLAGVTVSSISLHNEEFIKSKDIRIGDQILIERAGDVIPYIVKSFPELRSKNSLSIKYPTHCPSCKSKLEKEENLAAWRCINDNCKAQTIQKMIHHVSKVAMNIDGFGKSYIERFYELGYLEDLADIYNLDFAVIADLEGFGFRSAEKLRLAINKSKSNPIFRVLNSLSIHHLGQKASKIIAAEISNVLELANWKTEDYTNIKDIGPVLAENMQAYFTNKKNIDLLHKMSNYGVNLSQTEEDLPIIQDKTAPLYGKSILFTGTLIHFSRKEAQQLAEKAGAKNISAVSSKLDILVVGEKAGSKLKKANAIDTIQILTEKQFLAQIS